MLFTEEAAGIEKSNARMLRTKSSEVRSKGESRRSVLGCGVRTEGGIEDLGSRGKGGGRNSYEMLDI